MSVEKRREILMDQEHHEAKDKDHFPVGMRVLAVDDDQTCLNILGKMLERCCYQVTTTTQSIKALEMLRENKNQFDLVISDVNMPDMDGFKLLELVGHEMDLPVIMISGHKDINYVKKGVLHGACDYLLKPCRMQELQNIWQHVYRRQIDLKDQNKAFIEEKDSNVIREGSQAIVSEACNVTREGSQAIVSEINADQNKQLRKRRNEQDEEEEEDDDETEQESEDPSTQKKPRLLWSNELHRKFVAAVNQLGADKAVPKKILELMNDEGLTRENVASHLQKYRMNIRKEAQKTNTVDALGGSDAYLKLASLDGYASGSGRFSRSTLPSSYASGGVFSMMNSSSGLNLRGTSSSVAWPVQSQNMNGSIKAFENIRSSMFSANQSSNSLQGIPAANERNRFQQSNYTNGIRNFGPVDNLSGFKVSTVFANSRATVGNSNNHLSVFSRNQLQLRGNSTATNNSLVLRNHLHSPLGAASVSTKPFDTGICGASNLLDYNQCNESRKTAVQLSKFPANSLPLHQAFNSDQLSQNSSNFSSSTSHIRDIPIDFSSLHAVVPLEESRGGLQCQEGLIGNIVQASCHKPQQNWEQYKKDYKPSMNQSFNSLVPSNGSTSSLGHTSNQNSTIGMKRVDASLAGQLNEEATLSTSQHLELEKFSSDSRMKSNDACILQQAKLDGQLNEATPSTSQRPEPEKLNSDSRTKSNDSCFMQQMKSPQEGINHSDFESLDDLIVDIVNPELNGILFMNGEIVFDADPDGSFI